MMICICIAVVHFKNVPFKKFRPNCVLIQFAQSSDIRTVVQQQHNTN